MGTIPQELVSFKSNIESELSSMKASCTSLQEKIKDLIDANDTAKSGIDTYYNSTNKNTIINKFTSLNTLYNKINTSLSDDLSKMLSESQSLVDKIKELEDINSDIDFQRTIINSTYGTDAAAAQRIQSAKNIISSKETEFTSKSNDAVSLLNKLKAMDESLAFVEEFTISDYTQMLSQLQYGSFEKKSYKASNGVTVNYYVYIPDYGSAQVEGLPIHVYLHGSGECGNGVLNCGLPKMLNDKTITPSGIVICPQSSESNDFANPKYQAALIELTNKTAEDYNGDKNKISLSGHSMGAIAGYKMISNYPDHFSAFVPISGRGDMSEGLKNVNIWAFHGENDTSVDYAKGKSIIDQLKSAGANATLYTYPNTGHSYVQNYTFEQEFPYTDGNCYNPLEWAFRQNKQNA